MISPKTSEDPHPQTLEDPQTSEDPHPQTLEDPQKPSYVYLLRSLDGRQTYVGATVDLTRRLRQHNGELVGGAKYTTSKGKDQWVRIGYVSGFPTWNAALQFEWRWKQLTRKIKRANATAEEKRWLALTKLLALPQSTSRAVPFSQWPTRPVVHREM